MIFYLLKTDIRFPTVINYWPIAYLAQPVTTPVSKSIFQNPESKTCYKMQVGIKKVGRRKGPTGFEPVTS